MRYKKRQDYEEFYVENDEPFDLACCDCGLVHRFLIHRYRGKKIGIASRRESRATGQLRRHKYGYLQKDGKF